MTKSTYARGRVFDTILGIVPWALLLCGILLLARPVVSDWMSAKAAEESISEVVSVYDDMEDAERLSNLEQARAWNARLVGDGYTEPEGGLWDYEMQLTYRGTPSTMMSWVDIPSISTRLPIYHYATAEVLSAGVGHLEWSALPVGGVGTRCVVSAHSGMDRTRMFDDIRRLRVGDTFVFWTLSEPYCYRVCSIETILPEEVDRLLPEPGRDLATLVTCTPFGVNTHRLCVTGERIDYVETPEVPVTEGVRPYVNRRTIPLLAGILGLVIALVVVAVAQTRRNKRRKKV